MRNYEIMFIVRPTLGESETAKVVKDLEKALTSNGAKIKESKDLGQKEFAYEIDKIKSGHYFLTVVESKDDKAVKEFDRLASINGEIVRHLITKLED